MSYRACGNRCCVDFDDLGLPITPTEAIQVLVKAGFKSIEVDLIELARQCVESATYHRGARLHEAPKVFDCSSLTKWLYAQKGIWLPRRSIQQREFGSPVEILDIQAGDVVFVSGRIDYFLVDPNDGVGHVGIASGDRTVIHAANRKAGIIESSLESFVGDPADLRGIRRYVTNSRVYTFETPPEREIEWSDDLKWVILQRL
ncbi:TPA: hypothetical protein DCQ44_00170 [Candidatus Taylorbacteria bacterium]|nr:hypothetical protein [Candidatus Taylorbacteria bacterium]